MIAVLVVLIVVALIETLIKPRIDHTPEGKTFLWYGRESKRKFIEL